MGRVSADLKAFPFLFGGTFIEGLTRIRGATQRVQFPFLFGGTFIEGGVTSAVSGGSVEFPFLFGGTFIEGRRSTPIPPLKLIISLPFRRDFH